MVINAERHLRSRMRLLDGHTLPQQRLPSPTPYGYARGHQLTSPCAEVTPPSWAKAEKNSEKSRKATRSEAMRAGRGGMVTVYTKHRLTLQALVTEA